MLKITVLDGYTTNPGDLSWQPLNELGDTTVYPRTSSTGVIARAADANVLLTNKVVLDEAVISRLPHLRCICVLATGYNVVDTVAAKERKIPVCNVPGYASRSAAQHVFALLLELTNRVAAHAESVIRGDWSKQDDFSYSLSPTVGLAEKTIGIYGFGQIGQKVATIAQAFDMRVISHHKHPVRDRRPGITFVSFEEMLEKSDVVTLHAPLTSENKGIINARALSLMKQSAYLINTGRGGLITEEDLKHALETEIIAGAGLDVLSEEPPKSGNVLIGVKNCLITPHQAWATRESRQTLLEETVKNVEAFIEGNPRNVVN